MTSTSSPVSFPSSLWGIQNIPSAWTRLKTAPHLENNRIYVDVDDGIAVLEGTVETESKKQEAQQLAHIDGILGVNNHLRVWVD